MLVYYLSRIFFLVTQNNIFIANLKHKQSKENVFAFE